MVVGPAEIWLFVLLGLLALVALASLLAAVFCAFAFSVAPVLAGVADQIRRYRWRDWHPPTDWVPDLDATDPEGAARSGDPKAIGVTVVSSRAPGTNVELVTAQLPGTGEAALSTVTALHATLAPDARLDLPEDPRDDVAVLVVSGTGTVGSRRQVRAGDLAVLEPGEPVSVVAADEGSYALEVLVLGGVPSSPPSTGCDPGPEDADATHERPRSHRARPTRPVTRPTPVRTPKPVLGPAHAARRRGRPAAV